MEIRPLRFKDNQDVSMPAGQVGAPNTHDPEGAQNEGVTEFLVPWVNAQGSIQMIRAYLC